MNLTTQASTSLQDKLALNPPEGGQTARTFGEMGIILLAILLLTVMLVGIAYLVHQLTGKRRRGASSTRSSGSTRRHHSGGPQDTSSGEGEKPRGTRRRRRRRRRRPVGPTLAETGGLPPKRTEEGSSTDHSTP